MLYTAIFEQSHHAQVRYLLCGGFAVNLCGIPRMTADVEVLLDFTPENIVHFEAAMAAIAYRPCLPLSLDQLSDGAARVSLIADKNLIAYPYVGQNAGGMILGALVDMPFSFDTLWARRETRSVSGVPVQWCRCKTSLP